MIRRPPRSERPYPLLPITTLFRSQTHVDLEKSSVPATILGHVGDGNFHVIFSIDPSAPEEMAEVEAINARLVERALAMDGTCTGEHGIGIGKQEWKVRRAQWRVRECQYELISVGDVSFKKKPTVNY